ncbi:MurR/RpiR family transcriptional regulator [Brenneria rubrifaciens]|uniref:MurR/RpiR family transcriptional regulator n=1 Tax=Brenneria rubrifaciens TaxID=55213 RepID=A0A4P8QNM7_9GAMM|nr:MurR/RpiR family transcriptional regulator [Brenneria rubrifaciens]QCR07956.1 MurR/RpiR family transcriptional regulator [Brenneria rubrifaciens]
MKTSNNKRKRATTDLYGERFRNRKHLLSPGLFTVATYIHKHKGAILDKTAIEIAAETNTSDATVVRAIQALGFSGLRDLKNVLASYLGETLSSAARMASTVSALTPDTNASVDFVLEGYRYTCQMLAEEKNRQALSQATILLQGSARVAIFGLGASSILAEYTARLFNRNGKPAYVLNRTGGSLTEQLIGMAQGDVLIMMAQGSAHREGVTTLEEARRLGIPIILLTGASDSLFIKEADIVIFIPRSAEAGKIPIHGTPLICLEILVLALAASMPQIPLKTMNRLYELGNSIAKPKKPLR